MPADTESPGLWGEDLDATRSATWESSLSHFLPPPPSEYCFPKGTEPEAGVLLNTRGHLDTLPQETSLGGLVLCILHYLDVSKSPMP